MGQFNEKITIDARLEADPHTECGEVAVQG